MDQGPAPQPVCPVVKLREARSYSAVKGNAMPGLKKMSRLRNVLTDPKVRQAVAAAHDEKAAIQLVVRAGAEKGHMFTELWVKQAFDDVKLAREPRRLSDHELGSMMADDDPDGGTSANKLCHTASCGGNHSGCC